MKKALSILSLCALSLGLLRCDDTEQIPVTPVPSVSKLTVFDTLLFTKAKDGVAPGFDLDGKVSTKEDDTSCNIADLKAPDGTPGIDNQLATLVPLFEAAGIGAAEGLIQNTIKDGGLLLMLQLDEVESWRNDDSVKVTVRAGKGVPLLGTNGLLLSGQTFHLHPESPDSVGHGKIERGILTAGPFEAHLPVVVFGVRYDLTVHGAVMKCEVDADGELHNGVFGGSVDLADLRTIGEKAAMDDPSVLPAIDLVFSSAPDMAPDAEGLCQRVSAALSFSAVTAFYYPGEDTGVTTK
ncbi:MAG: hypothetical protein U0165_09775 [Polyangiaceae bacterium]